MTIARKSPEEDTPNEQASPVEPPRPLHPLDPEHLRELVAHVNVVIVHCTIPAEAEPGAYFIRETTYLVDHASKRLYPLLHAIGIRHEEPDVVKLSGKPLHFTLYFTGLEKGCTRFDLVERTPDECPFIMRNIPRNARDVYRVTFSQRSINDYEPNVH